MRHLNGNKICVVDTETTGLIPGFHEIIQVCVLPLGFDLKPDISILPFYMEVKPRHPERAHPRAMQVNGLDLGDLCDNAMEWDRVAELLEDWFEKLRLPPRKKIMPLAKNWPFDKSFMQDWLGADSFEAIFHYHFRDLTPVALYLKDRSDFESEPDPFPKISLRYLCSQLQVENPQAHDAMGDCIATAECYRLMMNIF